MSRHAFFAAMLRFVAAKPTEDDENTRTMTAILNAAAAIEADGEFTVAAADLAIAVRALAAVATLLQRQILPEAVAHGHTEAEAQIRWSVDAAMEAVTLLLREAAAGSGEAVTVRLPPPG